MKVVAISDQHGYLPKLPPCDLLLIAGDMCPTKDHSDTYQYWWLNSEFRTWLTSLEAKAVVGIAGNHDFCFETSSRLVKLLNLPWCYLQDTSIEISGYTIYGTPWTPWFFEWAFNAPPNDHQEDFLRQKYSSMPSSTDIVVAHGPPAGYGDLTQRGDRAGSQALLDAIDRVEPALCVFGHIHEGYGKWYRGNTALANVSLVNARYAAVNEPFEYELK